MGTRTLDWLDLLEVAQRPNAADRRITVAGLLAEAKTSRGTDPGFYVQTADPEYAADDYWALRTQRELILLRHLIAAGQVTADDGEDDDPADDDAEVVEVEVVTFGGEITRTFRYCGICGATESTPHDGAAHDAYLANLPDRKD